MKIATWNVNSIRARLDRLVSWLGREQPDVVCLQELKVADADFPQLEIEAAGYHAAVYGQKTYNGVAILAKAPLSDVRIGLGGGTDPDARLIAAQAGDVRVLSAYVPNGKVVGSDKWEYKLSWYDKLTAHLAANYRPDELLVLCGDFNVAPEERDVARPEEWRGSVLFDEPTRAKLKTLIDWGLVDIIRERNPEGPGPYTWWDYRMLGFAKGNGLRIDHILATKPYASRCSSAFVARDERKGKLPSDHAPVVAVFD